MTTVNKPQLTQMDPRDAVHYARSSPIALYIKLNTECDQQVTVVGRLLTATEHVHRRRVVNSMPLTVAHLPHSKGVQTLRTTLLFPGFRRYVP